MSSSLARVLAPEVRVNVVAPGFVDTPWMAAGYGAERYARIRETYASFAPLGSVAQPQDIAASVAWLLEDGAQVTGQLLYVDGGVHSPTNADLLTGLDLVERGEDVVGHEHEGCGRGLRVAAPRRQDLVPRDARRHSVGDEDGLDRLAAAGLEDAQLRDPAQFVVGRRPGFAGSGGGEVQALSL